MLPSIQKERHAVAFLHFDVHPREQGHDRRLVDGGDNAYALLVQIRHDRLQFAPLQPYGICRLATLGCREMADTDHFGTMGLDEFGDLLERHVRI